MNRIAKSRDSCGHIFTHKRDHIAACAHTRTHTHARVRRTHARASNTAIVEDLTTTVDIILISLEGSTSPSACRFLAESLAVLPPGYGGEN